MSPFNTAKMLSHAAAMASVDSNDGAPPVTRDPRFKAGRTLIQSGRANDGAVEIFATLLEETLNKYGDTSVEAAVCYYEYGNALLRAARLEQTEEEEESNTDDVRSKAAEAAQKRAQETSSLEEDSKPAAKETDEEKIPAKDSDGAAAKKDAGEEDDGAAEEEEEEAEEEGEDEEEDDLQLALEMMETAWSVLDKHVQDLKDENKAPSQWMVDQVPRILLGIGDVLTEVERHADAADVYTRALDHREQAIEGTSKEELSLSHLKKRRLVVEANVLVAESLLACPDGEDVVTSETGDVLVNAAERVDYARGYYDKARDELQETVYLLGRIAESGQDLKSEKEDVCFISTLLMGVGTTLAEYDERQAAAAASSAVHPTKRQKT